MSKVLQNICAFLAGPLMILLLVFLAEVGWLPHIITFFFLVGLGFITYALFGARKDD